MADHADDEDDAFEPEIDEIEDLEREEESPEGEGDQPETDEDETFIGFGEDGSDEQDEAGLPAHLRSRIKELQTEVRDLRAKVPAPQPIEVGPKPTMEGCEYDEDAYDAALIVWNEAKNAAKAAEQQATQPAQAVQRDFAEAVDRFSAQKAQIKVKDYSEREADVALALSAEQLAVIIGTANNSAAVIYALGKHPDRLAQLKATQNPLKLAYAVANLEKDLRVTTKKRAPEPEGTVRGSAPLSTGKDKQRERLEREAQRTGNRTELIRYDRDKAKRSGSR